MDAGGFPVGLERRDGPARHPFRLAAHALDVRAGDRGLRGIVHRDRLLEGDLGVYVNAHQIAAMVGDPDEGERFQFLRAIPGDEREANVTRWLTERAVEAGIRRHAGSVVDLFTPTGKAQIVRGKDLTAVRWIVGTGGALTRIEGGADILARIRLGAGASLLPPPEADILIDRDYRFSALGTVAQAYPDEVAATFADWVESVIDQPAEGNTERNGTGV